ncbi:MAG: glycosyltransferase [Acidobacteria bacterium]|nr:glycosyltransferase [Acidobacteriota bacterium]
MDAIRILHSVSSYLTLTENWIEPQVCRVPGTLGRVLCDNRANPETFPMAADDLLVDTAPVGWHWRIQRLLDHGRRRRGASVGVMRQIRRWRPHLLHAHFGQRGWQMIGAADRLGIPLVTSFYGFDAWMVPRAEPHWIERYAMLFSDGTAFLVEGPAMRDRLVALGCPESKIRVHRIGVNLSGLTFRERSFSGPLTVAMVGRFVEKKGLADGLRACALARTRGVDLRVTIVGDATPGDSAGDLIRRELRELAEGPEMVGRVHFTGFIPAASTSDVLRSHHVFLCPSRHATSGDAEGGSPVVLTEAMATGSFCVGTRHCDIPEVIVDGRTGMLAEEGDVEGLANALCAVQGNGSAVQNMTREGRRHVEERFSLATQLAGLGRIYRSLLS